MNTRRWIQAFRGAGTAVLLAAAIGAPAQTAPAQTAPTQDVGRWLIGFAAGGGTDTIARVLLDPMSRRLGTPLIIENRPGANGLLAMEELRKSKPDGRTLLLSGTGTLVMQPHIEKVPFDIQKDIAYVGMVSRYPLVAVTPATTRAKTLSEFVSLAKQQPGKLAYSSSGTGAADHFAGEMLKQETSIDMVHVPYKSAAAALPDLLEGRLAFHLMNIQVALPMIQAGRLTALAVTGRERAAELPQVPTVAEAGFPRLDITPWIVLIAPAGMAPEKLRTIHAALNESLADPAVRKRLGELGHEPVVMNAADARSYVMSESDRYRRIALNAGIKPQ
jgi:tripartite-type tricarboxylate transporter receptor subunit TctC